MVADTQTTAPAVIEVGQALYTATTVRTLLPNPSTLLHTSTISLTANQHSQMSVSSGYNRTGSSSVGMKQKEMVRNGVKRVLYDLFQ